MVGTFSHEELVRAARNTPHRVSVVRCTSCGKRWTAVRPEDVRIYELECPQCGEIGWAKETGEKLKMRR